VDSWEGTVLKVTDSVFGDRLSDMKSDYTPDVGDLVASQDHAGAYKVLGIESGGMIKLRRFLIGKQLLIGPKVMVPRARLRPFKEKPAKPVPEL
jgi:hypothetical protein